MLQRSNTSTMLGWVRPDLDKHLDQVRTQLEHIANSTHIGDGVKTATERLTQLKFTFETLVFQGATLVIEEMIAVCDALSQENIDDREQAFSALMNAIVIVPSYLDRLQAGHHDLPILLLPIINELRAAYNANIVSEAILFTPDLEVSIPELEPENDQLGSNDPVAFDESFPVFVARIRRQYEKSMLNWLQNQEELELASPLHSVCETMYRRLARKDLRRLWWIAAEVTGGLLAGVAKNDVNLRRIFARLNLNLKTLSEGGEAAPECSSVNAISQALLFHIAQAKPGNAGVDLLTRRFNLRELVPDRDVLKRAHTSVSGHNRELYTALGAAVRDELSLVKDALDLELRTGEAEPGRRHLSHAALSKLRDTLQMMGLMDSSRSVEELMSAFNSSNQAGTDPDMAPTQQLQESQLLVLAEKLLQVESVLEEQITTLGEPLAAVNGKSFIDLPLHEQQHIRSRLLDETVISLQQVQDAIRQKLEGEESADYSSALEHIAGALELIDEPETMDLAVTLRQALDLVLQASESTTAPEPDRLEIIVDAVTAFELYLAGCRDRQNNRSRYLEILKQRLALLPLEETAAAQPASMSAEPDRTTPISTSENTNAPAADAEDLPTGIDPDLMAVFLEEYEAVTARLSEQIPRWMLRKDDSELMAEIRRGFHTLKGSGRMVGADELGDFAWHIEAMINALLDNSIEAIDEAAIIVLLSCGALPELKLRLQQQPTALSATAIEAIIQQTDNIARGASPDWDSLRGQLPAAFIEMLPAEAPATQNEQKPSPIITNKIPERDTLQDLICVELKEKLTEINGLVDNISKDRTSTADDDQIRAIHTIAGTTALRPLGREAEIAKSLEKLLKAQRQSGEAFSNPGLWLIASSLAHFETCLAIHSGDPDVQPEINEDTQIDQLDALTLEYEAVEVVPQDSAAVTSLDHDEATETNGATGAADEIEEIEELDEEEEVEAIEHSQPDSETEPIDTEILKIFLQEAAEILERCDSLLNTWRENLPDRNIVQNLQREFHTFKGGARMVGIGAMGDLSHAMETLLERMAGRQISPSITAIEMLEQGCDHLQKWTEQANENSIPQAGGALEIFEQQVESLSEEPVQATAEMSEASMPEVEPEPETELELELESELGTAPAPAPAPAPEPEPEELQDIPDVEVEAQAEGVEVEPGQQPVPAQQIRVQADLLDSLVNCAGEISIFRSRMEQQVKQLREHLKESDGTVTRLRDQFRKLEIETETQIRSRYQEESPAESEEFDPLELDRFSSMQQLSRSLSESVADLLNLQELLDKTARKSETLLQQQARVNTELQEGLMQTRMVHFGSIAPRLRRIIRTAAKETNKKAQLNLRMAGGDDQLDRNVLERITAPLEHLLRNAIVHGIESGKVRKKLNKPEQGELSITVAAEATEFVVRVEDDGAGMDLKAIRKRAIELQLIDKKSKPRTQQLLQLILQSGFSTSKTVTALAGRGVGMDVVNSEIKQIGGSIEIDSEPGKGSRFTIRIPFTLAVMQAIGVMAGEHRYLIPLASVAGVARILPTNYQALLGNDNPSYEFAGEHYPVLELEPLLGEPQTAIDEDTISLLMIKSGEQHAAFRVPQLMGHQEIVIKPVGPQISSVPGILGGTITGDGQVVVIIDSGPLIRRALSDGARPVAAMQPAITQEKQTLALVVDDSITMRKVTSRVLEGQDFEVFTAIDGVDAIEQMQERIPELLLLDVEMPRMDGYQLAENVRADSRLRHIPIIMITSRAGKKHRERGAKAGANAYISKPYKESELISEVNKLLINRQKPEPLPGLATDGI